MEDPPVKGGIRIPVVVPINARERLKNSPKTMPKPRERAHSFATPDRTVKNERSGNVQLSPLAAAAKQSDASQWKTNALNFHEQVAVEVERLVRTVEDKEAANKASGALSQARIPHGSRNKINPERFSQKAEQVVTLLQRIHLEHPIHLHPPPT